MFVDIEETNGYVSEAITDTVCLQDINYSTVGADPQKGVYLAVSGYILAEDVPSDSKPNLAPTTPEPLARRNDTLSHLIDIEDVTTSMLIDSGTEIIAFSTEFECDGDETHRVKVAIETAGEVDVTYHEKRYTEPSKFPQSLRHLIRATHDECLFDGRRDDIRCDANNWFECVVYIDDEMFDDPEVIEIDFTTTCPKETADELAKRADSAISCWLANKTS